MKLNITELKNSNSFLNILIKNISSAVFIVDNNIKIQAFNDSFEALFHKKQDKIIGSYCGNAIGCINVHYNF